MGYSFVFPNNLQTDLAAPVASTDITISISSMANVPTLSAGQAFPVTLTDKSTQTFYEVCYCTGVSGSSLTVERGQEGTTARNWSAGDVAFSAVTQGLLNQVFDQAIVLSDVRNWGAKCDGVRYEDGVISGASFNQLSSSSYTFTSTDVGKTILCQTLVSGYPSHLEATTISSVSSGVATLSGASTKAYNDVVFYMGTDDITAVTNAQAYAASIKGPLYFPPGNCLLMSGNQYVTVSSGIEYYGDGDSSTIVSPNNAFNNAGLDTSSQTTLTQYAVNDITAGDDGFTTTTAADAANFSDGQLVWVNSTGNASGVPYFGQLCKIVSVDTSTGFVGVEGAFEDSYASIQVCAAPSTIPEGATIRDLKIVSSHYPWNSGGAYRCNARNVHIDADSVWGANAQTYCRYENISGRVWAGGNNQGRLAEFALNSYNSHLRGLSVQVVLRDTVSGQTALFLEHENSRGCTWDDLDVEAPQLTAGVLDTSSSLRASLTDYRITLNSCASGYLLYFYNNQSPPTVGGVTKMNHRSTGGRVKLLSGYQYGVGINAVAGSTLDGVFVDDVIVDGDAGVSPGYSVYYAGTGTIQNTRVLNSVIDGYEQVGSGPLYNNLISNLTSKGAQQPSVATNGGLKYVNCIRSGIATVPKNARIDYGTVTSTTANNPALTYSIPASVELHQGDKIRMRLRGECQTGTYTASFMVNIDGTTFGGTFTISPAGSAINFDAAAILTLVSGTYTAPDHFSGIVSYNNGFTAADAAAYLAVTVGAAHTIEWQVWISSGTGTIALQDAFIELIPVEQV